jgi:hypothetical protein
MTNEISTALCDTNTNSQGMHLYGGFFPERRNSITQGS